MYFSNNEKGEKEKMRTQLIYKQKGITLIELLVALTILGIVVGSIYRLFIAQTKAYTIQDQVVEVQQNVRGAMEFLLRDLRMTGFDDDSTPAVTVPTPIKLPVHASDIEVSYEYQNQRRTVYYWRDGSELKRELYIDGAFSRSDVLLENVDGLTFTYGVDENDDGTMDDKSGNGKIDDADWQQASAGITNVVAVRVTLIGRPDQTNTDVKARVSPRELTSAVTFRNLIMK
jgi:prepilin-type N-terminal cleavage/methylation domain-containing protein